MSENFLDDALLSQGPCRAFSAVNRWARCIRGVYFDGIIVKFIRASSQPDKTCTLLLKRIQWDTSEVWKAFDVHGLRPDGHVRRQTGQ